MMGNEPYGSIFVFDVSIDDPHSQPRLLLLL